MANDNNQATEAPEHSVSSAPAGRSVTFNVPSFRRPAIRLRDVASRTKASGLVLVLIVGLLGGFLGAWAENHNDTTVVSGSLSGQKKVVTSASQLISSIAKTVGPSVVSVNVDVSSQSDTTFGLFGFSQPEEEQAAGTGIILSSNGLIITNRHVVPSGTTSVSVTLANGTEINDVKVIGRTSSSDSLDIAFLQVPNAGKYHLKPAVLGNSAQVNVGDEVVAIGNALGQFQNTVTSGIISGYGRSVTAGEDNGSGGTTSDSDENLDDLFQTDAAINEGNSGGPLVNLNGQVIGINTAVASDSQNIGFAIPINDVKGLITQVAKTGKLERPYLGIRYIPLTADVAQQYGLNVSSGAYIAPSNSSSTPSVISGSPAAKAGLKTGDIITKLNGTPIDQTHSLTSLLDQHKPGDTVNLTVVNNGATRTVNVTLGTMPSS